MADLAPAEAAFGALRARGADRLDPTRWAFTQALARRMAAWEGPVRQRLAARLAAALAQWQDELERAAPALAPGVDPLAPGVDLPARGVDPPAPSIDAAARPASGAQALADLAATVRAMAPAEALPELRALRRFRRQWAQLRAEQRLAGALAQVPAKAGPLHSTGLAVRAIALMRARSPGYLQHLVVHADALLWLEAATGDDALPLPSPMRGAAPRRPRPRTGR